MNCKDKTKKDTDLEKLAALTTPGMSEWSGYWNLELEEQMEESTLQERVTLQERQLALAMYQGGNQRNI